MEKTMLHYQYERETGDQFLPTVDDLWENEKGLINPAWKYWKRYAQWLESKWQWRSVGDKPKTGEEVLLKIEGHNYSDEVLVYKEVGAYDITTEEFIFSPRYLKNTVTGWLPIPE